MRDGLRTPAACPDARRARIRGRRVASRLPLRELQARRAGEGHRPEHHRAFTEAVMLDEGKLGRIGRRPSAFGHNIFARRVITRRQAQRLCWLLLMMLSNQKKRAGGS